LKLLKNINISVPQKGGNITWVEIGSLELLNIFKKKIWIHPTDDFEEENKNATDNDVDEGDLEDPPLSIPTQIPEPILEESEIGLIRDLHKEAMAKYKLAIDIEPPQPISRPLTPSIYSRPRRER
jgi:hypothetical protein